MASFQSEIELRVKVVDKELNELEKRVQKIQNPFSASGASKGASKAELRARQTLLNVDKNRLNLQIKYKTDQIKQLNITNNWLKVLRQGEEVRKDIAKAAEREAKATQKTAASAQKAAKAKRNRGLQSAALGVGFPLLFGGGAGSVLGGALGSGGGFGGQILGSAFGQQIDQYIQGINELGSALTAAGLDIEKVTKAAGEVSTEAQKLIEETKEVAGAEAAAAAAASLLAVQVGQDGVTALQNFADANKELESAVAVLNSEFSVLAATLLGPVLRGVASLIERANLASQTSRILREGGPDAARVRAARQTAIDAGGSADDATIAGQAEAAKLLAERRQEALNATRDANLESSNALQLAEKENEVLNLKGDLLDDNVYLKKKELIELKFEGKLNKENLTDLEKKILKQERINELKGLENDRDKARDRNAKDRAREAEAAQRKAEAAAKKARQNTAALLAEQNKLYAVDIKITEATEGRAAAIFRELENLQAAYTIDAQRILLTTEDRALAQAKVDTLAKEYELKQILLRQEYENLQLQKDILALKQQQALEDTRTEVGRQIEDANLRSTGNNQYDEQLELRIRQMRRLEDVTTNYNNLIKQQELIMDSASSTDEQILAADDERRRLQEQLQLRTQLIGQLNQAEQAQLRYNQVLQAAQPFTEAFAQGLVGGLRDVVAGTKTAEEALADLINNVADIFLQRAAEMLAQALLLKAVGLFTGGSPAGAAGGAGAGGAIGKLFAEGGYVTGPTPALVGEGGEPEYVIPQSKMDSAMSRWSAGQSGNQLLADGGEMVGGGGTALADQPPQINISGGVTQINNEEFIRVDQIPAIVAQSAKAGEAKTLRRLRMSPGTRRQTGI